VERSPRELVLGAFGEKELALSRDGECGRPGTEEEKKKKGKGSSGRGKVSSHEEKVSSPFSSRKRGRPSEIFFELWEGGGGRREKVLYTLGKNMGKGRKGKLSWVASIQGRKGKGT